MAPTSVGFWGVPTSTLDWCEENYVVTSYIAEFWNTVSNLAFIIPPFLGMIQAIQDKLEIRFIIAYFSLLAVGIGSWFFHMTLLYEMQLFDELPMIWGSCIFLYCLIEAYSPPKSHNYKLGSALVLYSMLVTLVYLEVKSPVFFQACYGMLVVLLAGRGLYLLIYAEGSKTLLVAGTCCYLLGFILWNVDNHFCDHIRKMRHQAITPFKPITQIHAWWHVLAGLGTMMQLMYSIDIRCTFLKYKSSIQTYLGFWPYLKVDTKDV